MEKRYKLAIDTTEPSTGIGLAAAGSDLRFGEPQGSEKDTLARRGDNLTKIKIWVSERNQSQELLPKIAALLKANRVKPAQLRQVAVNLGPGSFTGLRVGISVANAFGYGLSIPVMGKAHLAGDTRERIQQLLNLNTKIKKFRQVLPVYGAPPHITKSK